MTTQGIIVCKGLDMLYRVRRVIIITPKPQEPQGCGCLLLIAAGLTVLMSAAVAFACL